MVRRKASGGAGLRRFTKLPQNFSCLSLSCNFYDILYIQYMYILYTSHIITLTYYIRGIEVKVYNNSKINDLAYLEKYPVKIARGILAIADKAGIIGACVQSETYTRGEEADSETGKLLRGLR